MHKYFLFLLLNLTLNSIAQDITIEGSVVFNDIPQSFVNIYMIENQKGTMTDDKGYYILENLTPGNYNLNISGLGFKTKNVKVNTTKGSMKLNIKLELDDGSLDEIVISGTIKSGE